MSNSDGLVLNVERADDGTRVNAREARADTTGSHFRPREEDTASLLRDPEAFKPFRITLTGADPSCSVEDLVDLLRREPRLELAFLFSDTQQGVGRYPPASWIHETVATIERKLGRASARVALHVCGRAVRRFLDDGPADLGVGNLTRFSRIQLNGRLLAEQTAQLRIRLMEFRDLPIPIITQYDANPSLVRPMVYDDEGRPLHQVLFDASGGRGIERREWPAHLQRCVCGYAGGLGPDNIARELSRIVEAAGGSRYWIDMESKLRDSQDHFSIARAREVLVQVSLWESGLAGCEETEEAVCEKEA